MIKNLKNVFFVGEFAGTKIVRNEEKNCNNQVDGRDTESDLN